MKQNVVCSYNEWDPLEEVIVGTLEGATVPSWQECMKATVPEESWEFFQRRGGNAFRSSELKPAIRELDEFARILESEGVVVKRPEVINFRRPIQTSDWEVPGGLYAAMPRDCIIVVGDQIIEAPMSWRSRHCEIFSYRQLLKDYFKKGARWVAAPTPRLSDEQYNKDYVMGSLSSYVITEYEPTFDTADFVRFGRDIFAQRSQVTNEFGIEWFERQLGEGFRVHRLPVDDPYAMHVDATLVPLCPGKLLVNRERLPKLPAMFKGWDILDAPQPTLPSDWPLHLSSAWVSINVLSLDQKRVIVERQEEPLISQLRDWGFQPILVDFRHVMTFGGSFHCVTCDVRRKGQLQSYF